MESIINPCFDFKKLSEDEIRQILNANKIALNPQEALKIQELLGRAPTLSECILWSIQGSEHCSYKSTRIHLKKLPTQASNVILGPKEDAGVVAVAEDKHGKRYGIVISHESHNHPSQIVPYEGAATGVGGNVRDVCCMGAEVIAVADCLRFGSLADARTHFIDHGVVAGIAGYGNPLGIPNLAGDVYYDEAYQDNCLVTVVTLGVLREEDLIHSYVPKMGEDYDLILVGKPTDNSGFGGASFASFELDEEDSESNKGAVQEPNAFLGRHLLKANYALFKYLKAQKLIEKVGFKDLGAGGISCATVEIADAGGFGAEVYLEKVHVGMNHLPPQVILCAETQERYLWAVPPELSPLILKHYNETFALPQVSPGAKASLIGKVRKDGRYVVSYQGEVLVDAKAEDVTSGILYDRPHQKAQKQFIEPKLLQHDLNETLLKLLAHENIASRSPIFECYDKQVQGRTLIERGLAAAGVLTPFNDDSYPSEIQNVAVVLSTSANPRYGKIDAYWTAYNAVIDSMRKVAAVGGKPQAITDCLCFGNPEKPEVMQEIIDAIMGLKDACESVPLQDDQNCPTPVISGNVSLYNESKNQQVPASPIVSCVGTMSDAKFALTPDFKQANSILIMVGERLDECGGSAYYQLFGELGANIPKPQGDKVAKELYALADLASMQLLNAAQVISDGGIAIALAQMSFGNDIGFDVDIPGSLALDKLLFSQTGGFVLEVASKHVAKVKEILETYAVHFAVIGKTTTDQQLRFNQKINLNLLNAQQNFIEGLRKNGDGVLIMIDYKSAGVDIDAGNEVVKRIKKNVQATYNSRVLSELGGFAGLYDLRPLFTEYAHPVLVQSIDGLGTKPMVASMVGKYDGLGFDLLSSTCNDIIVCGAKPLTLLDYVGGSKIEPDVVVRIVDSISLAAKAVDVALLGGETAEMPGVYLGNEYDVVGIITGVVDKDKVITGKDIEVGDVVLGFASSGLHTNGYSLARKLCFEVAGWSADEMVSDFKASVADTLLAPHINYTLPVLELLKQGLPIHGMAHITGGGLLENVPRILPKHYQVEIQLGSWPVLPIFKTLVDLGQLVQEEAYRTFNMGIGYVMVVRKDAVSDIRRVIEAQFKDLQVYEIGKVVKGEAKVVLK